MPQIIPQTPPDYDRSRLFERPDGFYWQPRGNGREHGPFATLLGAVQDMQYREDPGIEPGETLSEAQAELGIADWIDPDTGEPAEQGIPRLEEH